MEKQVNNIIYVLSEGVDFTPEMEQLAKRYDFFHLYIDNYGDMIEAEHSNMLIMEKLKALGCVKIKRA